MSDQREHCIGEERLLYYKDLDDRLDDIVTGTFSL